jgi:very-short-patch-repair endonuclease
MDRPRSPYLRYRRDLKARAQRLRRDPTAPERRLWYEFLGERYDKIRTATMAALSLRVLRFTNAEVMHEFEAVCQKIDEALKASSR